MDQVYMCEVGVMGDRPPCWSAPVPLVRYNMISITSDTHVSFLGEYQMKAAQHKEIFDAVRANVENFIVTQGEGELINIEHFDDNMFDLFESLYEKEISRLAK